MVITLKRTKLFLINGIILTLTTLFMRSVGFIFNIYIAKKVGSETIGVFQLVMSVYLFAITFATSGISLACTCIVSEELEKKNYNLVIKTVKLCIVYSVILGAFCALLLVLFSPTICTTWLKNKITITPIYSMALGLPLIAFSSVIGSFLNAVGKPFKNSISQIAEFIVKIVSTLILLKLYFSSEISNICTILILADVISEVASFVLNIIFYHIEKNKIFVNRNIVKNQSKKILKIAFPVAITSYIRSGLSSFKQFLIPISLERSGLSYSLAISNYGVINGMVMPILMFFTVFIIPFSNLLIPEFSRLLAGKNYNRMKTVTEIIFKNIFIFSIFIAGTLLFFSSEISYLIYQNFECSNWIKILSPLVIFMYIDNIIDNLLKGINEQFKVMCCNILDLVVTITILYFVVPIIGMNGYILSIYVSEILNFTISMFQFKNRIPFKISFKKYIVLPIIACICSYLITSLLNFTFNNFLFYIISKILIFLIFYLLCIFLGYYIKNLFRSNYFKVLFYK